MTAEHARTFYFASHFLGREKRRACYAVYAFCRYVDDLVDEVGGEVVEQSVVTASEPVVSDAGLSVATPCASSSTSTVRRLRAVEMWREELDRVYAGRGGEDPVMIAWADLLERYDIPKEPADQLIEGCVSDLERPVRMADFAELRDYCYKVASTVGLMTGKIFGYEDPAAEGHAIDLGIAMQLTNILRDVGEDAADDRIYLPLDELAEAGIEESEIIEGILSDRFRAFMRKQIARARDYYASAEKGIAMLEPESRRTVRLMSRNYAGILAEIERNDFDVFTRRARVPGWKKLASLFRA